ncbi:unnamed protein product [Didymodactylos carnosus]|uniref:Uncharacterized protein n=1 Tax=Didymodactylos carnosus TaxID=1234261 RepID=A0A814JI18_9BILA|nr:unnamed protein product [Didymodactylos carnosus]CAF1440823.1 unnamed protein product [Didymodactylos carnosus]CAF3808386.1 unnamed protein product [Didymodactylos carnosus]CAF4237251.1 unnamed protein product [Didymodactylos carnosus]
MGVNPDKETQVMLNNPAGERSWVPTVFCTREHSFVKVYGGINLQAALRDGPVNRVNIQVQQYNAQNMLQSRENNSGGGGPDGSGNNNNSGNNNRASHARKKIMK